MVPSYVPKSGDAPVPYTKFKHVPYSKAGYPNAIIDVFVHTLGEKPWKVNYVEPPTKRSLEGLLYEREEGNETDGWGDKKRVNDIVWMGDSNIMIKETNRVDDHFRAISVDVPSQSAQIFRDEKLPEGWFEFVRTFTSWLD